MNGGNVLRIETMEAERFDEISKGGATEPMRMGCVSGVGKRIDVYVRYNSQACPVGGLARELIGSMLAKNLGVAVADVALVNVSSELVAHIRAIDPVSGHRLFSAVNPKLGSINVGSGFRLCSHELIVTPVLRAAAFKMWVFDELIFNFDRTQTKPNCLFKGSDLIAIDHEKSLNLSLSGSFLCPAMPWESSWRPNKNHIFYSVAKQMGSEFTTVEAGWSALNAQSIDSICSIVPTAWDASDVVEQIRCYLMLLHRNLKQSLENLRRTLS